MFGERLFKNFDYVFWDKIRIEVFIMKNWPAEMRHRYLRAILTRVRGYGLR